MSAPSKITPGLYRIELITIQAKGTQSAPTPKFYLTSNGEGNQLTLEEPTGHSSQEWKIQPPLGEDSDSLCRIIVPWVSKDDTAVSQDVVERPDQVSLIKNLQVWQFNLVPGTKDEYEIRSNLYAGLIGSDPLLGSDKGHKKVIIEHISNLEVNPKPSWILIGPL